MSQEAQKPARKPISEFYALYGGPMMLIGTAVGFVVSVPVLIYGLGLLFGH